MMTEQEKVEQYFLARLLYWRSELFRPDNATVKEIVNSLQSVKLDLDKRLQADADGIAQITDWTRERLEAASAWCDEVLAGANSAMGDVIGNATVNAASASLEHYNKMLSFDGKASFVITAGMTYEQLKSWFISTPLGGESLQGWINRAFTKGVKDSLLFSLQKSGVEGKGTAESTKRLLQTALDEGVNITTREAITLTRTYIQTANVQAQKAVYDANPDIVYGYEWVSVLDNRVCLRCAALDGVKYLRGEKKPAMPCHPRCRCLWRPLVRIKALGITSEDLGNVTRNWIIRESGNIDAGGKRKILAAGTTQQNFDEWFENWGDKEQLEFLGKKRYELLKNGDVGFNNLIDKTTGRLRTIKEILQ